MRGMWQPRGEATQPKVACLERLLNKISNGNHLELANRRQRETVSLFSGVVAWMSDNGRAGSVNILSRRLTLKARRVVVRGRDQG